MARVLVTEEIAEPGLDRLRAAGHDVDVQLGWSPSDLPGLITGAHALIIRSATQVTDELLAAAPDLVVVGRAGIGLDNVDVPAATRRGVMVVNAPQSNAVSAAEHTMAMLLAQARNIPQAHGALVAGRWERSRWEGVELDGKRLGVVGFGQIGRLVASRAAAFGMKIAAYDPYVTAEKARQLGAALLPLEQLVAEADFLTIHLPNTAETRNLINRDLLLKARPHLRIVNVARGGIVNEADLAEAIRDGLVAGAAVDVFASEPTTESPLFGLDQVVVTPHLGASTREAQDKAGDTIAEMIALALANEPVPFAVNVEAADADDAVRPFIPLAEQLGRLFATLLDGLPENLEVCTEGTIAGHDVRILVLSVLKGLFSGVADFPVTYVNAPQLAREHGLDVRQVNCPTSPDFTNLVTLRADGHSIAGTLVGGRKTARIVEIDGHSTEVPPAPNMLLVRNDDRPGVIGTVGTLLGAAGVNIDDMDVGRAATPGSAVMVIVPTAPVSDSVLAELSTAPGIISVRRLSAG